MVDFRVCYQMCFVLEERNLSNCAYIQTCWKKKESKRMCGNHTQVETATEFSYVHQAWKIIIPQMGTFTKDRPPYEMLERRMRNRKACEPILWYSARYGGNNRYILVWCQVWYAFRVNIQSQEVRLFNTMETVSKSHWVRRWVSSYNKLWKPLNNILYDL